MQSLCKVCGESHGSILCRAIKQLCKEINQENGDRQNKLAEKCRWEQVTRGKILKDYGDPKNWDD